MLSWVYRRSLQHQVGYGVSMAGEQRHVESVMIAQDESICSIEVQFQSSRMFYDSMS